jgi:hypothetical protein
MRDQLISISDILYAIVAATNLFRRETPEEEINIRRRVLGRVEPLAEGSLGDFRLVRHGEQAGENGATGDDDVGPVELGKAAL